ncbi:MAG: glycosyltransferase [Candidatus Shapirobacteria bacterium]
MKIALVYDRVNKIGGAERVLTVLHEIWPSAPLFTAVYHSDTAIWADNFEVVPSFLNCFPWARQCHEFYPWLTPLAFESFDFGGFDLVISVASADAKGIITGPKTFHLNYCLTPTRYLWGKNVCYFPVATNLLKRWDLVANKRPDGIISISRTVQGRVRKYYGRESEIIYPPVDSDFFKTNNQAADNYFLIVSRLVAYKKIDIAIKAFNRLGWPLKIIGIGREMHRLRSLAQKNIEFLGQLTDEEVLGYYQKCAALVFPGEEDFGLTPLEAQACGKPVLAYRGGGATETVIGGVTGEFFDEQTEGSLITGLKSIRVKGFNPKACRRNALKFGKERFKKEFKKAVEEKYQQWQKKS